MGGSLSLNFVIIVCVTLAVQIFSGIGIAATLLPVISSAALQAVVNPLLLLLPATVASSFAFLLPTATPSNVVVFDTHAPFPQWACSAAPASCVFLDAPGVVQGQQVPS